MLKLIAVVLVLLCNSAHATDYFYSRMGGNALLVLTADKAKCLFGKSGFLFSMTGEVLLTHCWEVLDNDTVQVNYSDGTNRIYPNTMFTRREQAKPSKPNY